MAERLEGYRCEFVEIPSHLKVECHFCSLILRDPHVTECCGRNVCLPCAEGAKKSGKPCPLCGSDVLQTTLDRRLRNELLECEVRCPSKIRGCSWVDKLQKYDSHEKTCNFAEVDCPLECGLRLQRSHCEDHMLRVCERSPLPCPNRCGKMSERRFRSIHLRECPLERVGCVFGCKSEVKRKDVNAHFESEFQTHLRRVSQKSNEMQTNWKERKQAIIVQHEKKVRERDSEIDDLEKKLHETDEKLVTLQRLLSSAERELEHLQEEQRRNKAELAAESAAVDQDIQMLKEGIAELQVQAKTKCFGPPPPKLTQVVSRPYPSTVDVYVPPVTFVLDKFDYRKRYQERWYSPPFYSHDGGYKMCLEVYPDGYDRGRYNWVSIFVAMVRGENDDYLKWPFSGSITVVVLNQKKNSFHKLYKIVLNHRVEPVYRQQVRNGFVSSSSYGFQQFIAHKFLYPPPLFPTDYEYLKNDCLLIRVAGVHVFNL